MNPKKIALSISVVFTLFFVFLNAVGSQVGPAEENQTSQVISTTPSTQTLKNPDGTYTTTLYSGSRFAYEDEEWKPVEEARSLKGTWDVVYLENDTVHIIEVVDYNASSIILNFAFNPDSENFSEFEYEVEDGKMKTKFKIIRVNETTGDEYEEEVEIEIEEGDELVFSIQENPMGKKFKLGENSTTVTLQDADTENLEDTYVNESSTTSNYGTQTVMYACNDSAEERYAYLGFNLSVLYNDNSYYAFDSASLTLKAGLGQGDKYYVHHVYNQTWNEEGITWDDQPCDANLVNDNQCNLTAESSWNAPSSSSLHTVTLSVTNAVSKDVSQLNNRTSFLFLSSDRCGEVYNRGGIRTKEGTASYRPSLTITYTPYVDILSPTASQIFTDEAPTSRFEVATAVDMDECRWTNNSGVTNYTLTRNNATNFSYVNTSMSDGSYTVRFWCNESSENTWRKSTTVSFDVDSLNITTCRDLTVAGRNYSLNNEVTRGSDCLTVTSASIGLDCQGNVVNSTGFGTEAITVNADSFSSENCIIGATGNAIEFDNHYNAWSVNNTLYSSLGWAGGSSGGSYILTLIETDINGTFDSGWAGYANTFLNFSNVNISTFQISDATTGNKKELAGNISDSEIYSIVGLNYDTDRIGVKLFNVSVVSESIGSTVNASVERLWHADFQVNDSNGNAIENANITAYNTTGSAVFSLLTDSNGQIARHELTEYINLAGTKTLSTPHTINVSKDTYDTNSTTFNLTTEENIRHEVVLLPTLEATIELPESQSYAYNISLPFNYTITNSTALDSCIFYVLDSGDNYEISNTSITCNQNQTFNISQDGSYTLGFYVNGSSGRSTQSTVDFSVSTTKPSIVLDYPANDSYFSIPNITFNFTATTAQTLDTCKLYTNWTGVWAENYTWVSPNNATQNTTQVNITQGDATYLWNVWCNDSAGEENFGFRNNTFTVDTTYPIVEVDAPTTSAGSLEVSFTSSYTELHCDQAYYSVQDIDGLVDNGISNVSMSCENTNASFTVSGYASYLLYVYIEDKAGNINYASRSFTTTASAGGGDTGGGGGGGTTLIVENLTWSIATDTGGERYDFFIAPGGLKTRQVVFQNLGDNEVKIEVSCADIVGDACAYVNFSSNQVTLNGSGFAKEIITFTVSLPDDFALGSYDFNIVGTSQDGGDDSIAVRMIVSEGVVSNLISKSLGSTAIGKTSVPNSVFIIGGFVLIFPTVAMLSRKSKYRFLFASISGGAYLLLIYTVLL